MTYGESLTSVREAIYALTMGGVTHYKLGEQEVTRLQLKELQNLEKYYFDLVQAYGADFDPVDGKYVKNKVSIAFC